MSKNNIIKCAKCPKPAESRYPEWRNGKPIYAYKGQNNTELCCKCGENLCWKCGKKEGLFSYPFEETSYNPGGGWYVCYCRKCLPERKNEEKVVNNPSYQTEKQPNSQSNNQLTKCSYCQNIVYTGDTYSCVPCGTVYCSKNCCEASAPQCKSKLDGRNQSPQNNSKSEIDVKNDLLGKSRFGFCKSCNVNFNNASGWYNLMVENNTEYYGLSHYNYCLDCWKIEEKNYRSRDGGVNKNSKLTDCIFKLKTAKKDFNFNIDKFYYYKNNKWIGEKSGNPDPDLEENDNKIITIPNNTNKTSPTLAKIPNKDELIITLLIQFFKSNSIKQITLNSKSNLTIEYESVNENSNQLILTQNIGSHELTNNQELQEVINYCEKSGKNSLSQQELMSVVNSTSISSENPQDNSGLKIGLALGIGGTLLVLMITILLIRKRTIQKLKYK